MNVIFFPFHKRRKPSPTQLRQRQQLEELREVKRRLDAARYSYLLHQAKLDNLRCESIPLASL